MHTTASTEPGRFKDSSVRPDATGFLPGADDEAQLGHVRQAPDRLGVDITDHAGTDDREPDLGS
jgi:hypothetical protein